MSCVLDASAMIAFLRGEPGGRKVLDALTTHDGQCLAHVLNLCEVYYDFYRSGGPDQAESAIADLIEAGVSEENRLSAASWRAAGALKAVHRRVSLADCFAIALANERQVPILTADHHEFDPLVNVGACHVEFIR